MPTVLEAGVSATNASRLGWSWGRATLQHADSEFTLSPLGVISIVHVLLWGLPWGPAQGYKDPSTQITKASHYGGLETTKFQVQPWAEGIILIANGHTVFVTCLATF